MTIIPNPIESLLLTLPFIVAFVGLYGILFKPLLDYLEERESTSTNARLEAEEFRGRMDARMKTLDEQLDDARAEVAVQRGAARTRAAAAEHEILTEARADAEETIADAITSITAEKRRAKATLASATSALSADIVDQVLA